MSEQPDTTEEHQIINSNKEAAKLKKVLIQLFIFMLIGMCLGVLIVLPRIPGLFNQWEKLPAAPVRPTELLGTGSFWDGPGKVYVQAEDGQDYLFRMSTYEWSDAPKEYKIASFDCDLSTIKFSNRKRPFDEPFQCAQIYGHGSVSVAPLSTFVLDQKGDLWYWNQEASLFYLCAVPLLAGIGLIFGIFLNIFILAIWRIRLKLTHKAIT